jgi:hypothetical protein
MRTKSLLFLLLAAIFGNAIVSAQPSRGVVHVMLFMHNEDSALNDFSIPQTQLQYNGLRNGLVQFARMVQRNKIAFCWQSDWKFLEGVLRYETPDLMATTNGKNLVRWLKEDIGISVDPHSHENYGYNYADVAHLMDSLGVAPTNVIGGHIYDPYSSKYQDWERFRQPLAGEMYPWSSWQGDILMGSGTPNHTYDPEPSGIWRPKGKYEYWTVDPNGNVLCIGQYSGDVKGVQALVDLYKNGTIAPENILTASIYVGQSFPAGSIPAYEDSVVKPLLAMQQRGEVRIVNFVELIDIWKAQYNSKPFLYNAPVTTSDTLKTFVASSAGGETGIYAQVVFPHAARYNNSAAPVVIHVPGGWEGNGLSAADKNWPLTGFIEVRFNFPGSGRPGAMSGGIFDDRGENCLRALCDVTRFALGKITDKAGHYLHDYSSSIKPMYTNVGLCGWSNGGNATISTAGALGDEIKDLAWIVNWESPVGDGMPNVEAGGKTGGLNPAYNPDDGTWHMEWLAYDSGLLLQDKDNPQISYVGGFYFDVNGNHVVDKGTDFIITPYYYKDKVYYSVRVRQAAENNHMLPATPPAHMATLAETSTFWSYRNGEYWISQAVSKIPRLMFLVEAGAEDHVQGALDHPHVLIQYEGFRSSGARFVRLNPDRNYVEEVAAKAVPLAVDNSGLAVFDHMSIRQAVEPTGANSVMSNLGVAAAILELADRTANNNLDLQIGEVTTAVKQAVQPVAYTLFSNYPNPFNPSTTIVFSLREQGPVTLAVYDLLGRQVAMLVNGTLQEGKHEIRFEANDLAGGTYFVQLVTPAGVQNHRIALVK